LMWMQPAPAHHLGPMRMRLREPVGTGPLCRVASHALFGYRLRSGSPPVPDSRKLTESPRNASGTFRKPRKSHLVSLREPAAVPAKSNGSYSLRASPHRPIHLADHAPIPAGSSHPLSPVTLTQSGNKSSALAKRARCDGNQFIALPADNPTTPTHPEPISISSPNVKCAPTGAIEEMLK
jgi:hypothetical protein